MDAFSTHAADGRAPGAPFPGAPSLGAPSPGALPMTGGGARPGRAAPSGDATALLLAVAGGDRAAFATLFRHFAPRLKTYLIRLGAPAPVAEDLAQETMFAVWRKAPQFDPARAGAATWIFTIARNLRIDALRRDRRPGDDVPDPLAEIDATPPADALLSAAEHERLVARALGALPPEQADVVRLSFFEDKPHAEIERALGIPLGTVKSRLRLAMGRLRGILDGTS